MDLGETAVVRPGETVQMSVELGREVPLEPGLGFAVREGGRTVGRGTVTAVEVRRGAAPHPGTMTQ